MKKIFLLLLVVVVSIGANAQQKQALKKWSLDIAGGTAVNSGDLVNSYQPYRDNLAVKAGLRYMINQYVGVGLDARYRKEEFKKPYFYNEVEGASGQLYLNIGNLAKFRQGHWVNFLVHGGFGTELISGDVKNIFKDQTEFKNKRDIVFTSLLGVTTQFRLGNFGSFNIDVEGTHGISAQHSKDRAWISGSHSYTSYIYSAGLSIYLGGKKPAADWYVEPEKKMEDIDTSKFASVDDLNALKSDIDDIKGKLEALKSSQPTEGLQPTELVSTLNRYFNLIKFDFNSDEIKSEFEPVLDEVYNILVKYPDSKFLIEGNTDDIGTREYNQELSVNRAKAVLNYLVNKGVSSDRLIYSGYGKDRPRDVNSTDEGRYNNRRVEISLLGAMK